MILAINVGSSSIKIKIFDIYKGKLLELLSCSDNNISDRKITNFSRSFLDLIKKYDLSEKPIYKVAYRVVHGGVEGKNMMIANSKNIKIIKKYAHLSPNHNPYVYEVIKHSLHIYKKSKHYLFFDTSYFSTMPEKYSSYPLSDREINGIKIKKYGFHGLSHQYMYEQKAKAKKAITVHLGAGSSISAINESGPIDTTMGMTPLGGTLMFTRCGDTDPGMILEIVKKHGIKKSYEIFARKSGIKSISNKADNMLDILFQAYGYVESPDYKVPPALPRDNTSSKLASKAIELYVSSIQKYICDYYIKLKGCDVLVFGGKIGFGSKKIRSLITKDIKFLNIKKYEVIDTDEEKMMALMLTN